MNKLILTLFLSIPLITGCSTTYYSPLPNLDKTTLDNGTIVVQYTRQVSIPTSCVYRTTFPPSQSEKSKEVTVAEPKPWFTVTAFVEFAKSLFEFTTSAMAIGKDYYGSINSTVRYREDFLIVIPKTNSLESLTPIMKELTKPMYDGQRSPWQDEKN